MERLSRQGGVVRESALQPAAHGQQRARAGGERRRSQHRCQFLRLSSSAGGAFQRTIGQYRYVLKRAGESFRIKRKTVLLDLDVLRGQGGLGIILL